MTKPNPADYGAEQKPDGTWHWEWPEDQDEYTIALEAWQWQANPPGGDGIFYYGEPPVEEGK